MPKLIPLSSKKMKEMGIVKSKNGYLMQPIKSKSEKHVEGKPAKPHVEPSRQSTNNNNSVSKVDNRVEAQRLFDRGIY